MKKPEKILIIFLVFQSAFLAAQTPITGRVTDTKGEPLPGANIYIEGTFDGTSTDSEGFFSFRTEASGGHNLIASFIGYEEAVFSLDIGNEPVKLGIEMKEKVNLIDMVTITAGSFETGDITKKTVLRELDIVTTAGATSDIAGVLNTLPGTQTVGEEGKLYVRGGDDNETKTFIDGMRVINPYYTTFPNIPTRNRFSPFMFKGTSFSTGGYSAEFGQGLSSALILSTKEKADQTRTDLTFIPFGAEIAQCIAEEKTSMAAKLGYFNMTPYYMIVPQQIEWNDPPESVDANLVFRRKAGKNGLIKAYGNFTWSTSEMVRPDIDDPTVNSPLRLDGYYGYLNTSYKNIIGKKWTWMAGFSWSGNFDNYGIAGMNVRENSSGGQAKLAFYGDISKYFSVKAGAEYFKRDNKFSTGNSGEAFSYSPGFTERILVVFLETDIYLSKDLLARTGFRTEYGWLNREPILDPRISLAWQAGPYHTFSVAWGHFQQAARDDLLRIVNDLENEKSTHYLLSYQYNRNARIFRIEGYYKKYGNLVKFDPQNMYDPDGFSNSGTGYARGIDVFWRDCYGTIKNADYWISYSFLDTKRNYRDFPIMAIPAFASRHNVSVVYKQFIPSLKAFISGTWTFASGRPYQDPNSDEFNSGLTKSYHDLSASIAYMATDNIGTFLMCTNILGRENVFGYEYSSRLNDQGVYNRTAIVPPAKRMLVFGVTITLSKNGVMNQLRSL